jgi:alkylhydroperoxidase family enzyme
MSDFTIHSMAQSTASRRAALAGIEKRYGKVPNVIGGMAESPAAVNGYIGLIDAMRQATFTPTELHVVWFTINLEHNCCYCMSAHTPWAMEHGVPQDVIDTARAGGSYSNLRLEALRAFTLAMVRERGWVDTMSIAAFLSAGFTRENIFEIIAAIAYKVMTNYTNHIVEPELDEAYRPYRWTAAGSQVVD